jgi:acyl-CoA hydrolase
MQLGGTAVGVAGLDLHSNKKKHGSLLAAFNAAGCIHAQQWRAMHVCTLSVKHCAGVGRTSLQVGCEIHGACIWVGRQVLQCSCMQEVG